MATPIFKGFASNISSKKIYDVDLIKADLLNRINTKKGERVMDPNFGSIIWDLLFEHKTEFVVNEITRDLQDIIASDSRVVLQTLEVLEVEYGYLANMTLFYNGLSISDQFTISFNKDINQTQNLN